MEDDVLKKIEEAIKNVMGLQDMLQEKDFDKVKLIKEYTPGLAMWLQYESMRVNLVTQKYVLEKIKDTERITTLAYRVALISFGASLISIISSLM